MPGGNGTGPAGFGPMTGRSAGYCAGFGVPGYANRFGGRGFGMGFGRGRGWRNRRYAPEPAYPGDYGLAPYAGNPGASMYDADKTEQAGYELDDLRRRAEFFESSLNGIRSRIEELESRTAK